MRYLITGGNGFIGRRLIEYLSRSRENQIYVLDISHDSILEKENIVLISNNLLTLDSSSLPEVDCLIHAAALLGVDFVENNPLETILDNIGMFRPLVRYIKDDNVKIVFFSTSEVYGDGLREDLNGNLEKLSNDPERILDLPRLDDPRSSYPISKIVGEFISANSKDYIILRPHNIYGPNMGVRHVIPQLIRKIASARNGEKVELFNPNHWRSFCFIDDAVSQMVSLIEGRKSGVFNVGNPSEPIKICDLFETISLKMNKKIMFKEVDKHKTSPGYRQPIIKDNFNEYSSLSVGLDSMIDFYKNI